MRRRTRSTELVVLVEEMHSQGGDYRSEHDQYKNFYRPTTIVGCESQPSSDEVHATNPAFNAG
jgi:hypothetical protein